MDGQAYKDYINDLSVWQGSAGDQYHKADDVSESDIEDRLIWMKKALAGIGPKTVLEVGCGNGSNLIAMKRLFPQAELWGTEPNNNARKVAKSRCPSAVITAGDVLGLLPEADLVMCIGVLIHVRPEVLDLAADNLWKCTRRALLITGYYNGDSVIKHIDSREYFVLSGNFAALWENSPSRSGIIKQYVSDTAWYWCWDK
jgi:SAM-dependent methyltransferase